ncbi:MAG TPA: hydrogenase maturation protease [Bacteroidales bacterium]|nr:hydrogenase maturation protease [Bacteroidales bacterium]HPE56332.1 hydrogenase maturation protease [Bacteroidales bacterium]HRX95543.1 hydrogenase maturation protease [Bacteroidales bacterium]
MNTKKILIMGMGNILLSDEGVGVRSVEYMQNRELPVNVDLLDGGTGGFTLLPEIMKYDEVILIDATLDDLPPGTIRVIQPRFAADFPRAMSTHDIGLKDLIESASIMGKLPPLHLIVITIPDFQPMELNLSDEIQKVLPDVYQTALEILKKIDH